MPRSLKVRQEALQLVNAALRRNAYLNQRNLAEDLNLALSTVSNFLRGKPVDRAVFHELCEKLQLDWQSIVETNAEPFSSSIDPVSTAPTQVISGCNPVPRLHQDWGEAPEVPAFFGREAELATLEQWILSDRCRVVAILGMAGVGKTGLSIKLGSGGMGKTNLSLKLAQGIQDQFEFVIWRSLLNAPPLNALLTDVIKVLSNQHEILLPEMADDPISRLLHYLRQHRCLIILDNAETLLEAGKIAGQYRAGYEDYGKLLRQIGEVSHQSCLLLTSREKFKEIARLEGKTRSVRSLELTGLSIADGKRIFAEVGDFSGTGTQWHQLIELYNGNPLALELAAKHIHEIFASDL